MSAHLQSAARVAQAILEARHPEQAFVVEVGERHRPDGHGNAAAPVGQIAERAVGEEAHPFGDRDDLAATDQDLIDAVKDALSANQGERR